MFEDLCETPLNVNLNKNFDKILLGNLNESIFLFYFLLFIATLAEESEFCLKLKIQFNYFVIKTDRRFNLI